MVEGGLPENVPRRLGRYDVVGVLAMRRSAVRSTIVIAKAKSATAAPPAEALGSALALSYSPLAPNEGTATFQKPVAIKILAPALAGEAARLAPFLSTARAVIEIKHSSVAQIHEVGQAGSDVFLVMDYVAGETAATLMRQLHSRGETLDYKLAAHIIAEAAGGLEAAHAAGILHEQLTPHDLFVGYDGSVRVLDIGIAAARSWLAGESGDIGLGVEYSSPERCKKEPLDRRTDVFSLGTMLWELNTGISPFERAKKADTMRSICEEQILPPHNVVPGLPESVSTITMKALERDKDARYASALALRQALIGLRRSGGSGGSPALDLSRLMKRVFEGRVADKAEMLRRVDAGKSIVGLDVRDAEEADEPSKPVAPPAPKAQAVPPTPPSAPKLPPVPPAPPSAPATPSSAPPKGSSVSTSVVPRKSNPPQLIELEVPSVIIQGETADALRVAAALASADGRDADTEALPRLPVAPLVPGGPGTKSLFALLLVGGALLLVLVATALAFGFRKTSSAAAPQASTSAAAPIVASAAGVGDTPAPPASSTVAAVAPVASATVEAPPEEETLLHIETVPSRATIFVAGNKMGMSPLDIRMPRRSDTLTLEIRRPGYQTLKERVVPDVNQRLKLTLIAAGNAAPAAAASAPYHKFE